MQYYITYIYFVKYWFMFVWFLCMSLDYEKFIEQWFEAIPTAIPNPNVSQGWAASALVALSIVLHPEPRNSHNLQAIAATHNYPIPTQLLRYQTGTNASLLYNLDLFDDTLRAQYPTTLDKILISGIYSHQEQAYTFFKKYLSAVSNAALDILMMYYKKPDLVSDDPEQFWKFWSNQGIGIFMKQVDTHSIWSQYQNVSKVVSDMPSLSQKLVYKTVQQRKKIDLHIVA